MNNIEDVMYFFAIAIGVLVACTTFLLSTGPGLKAIQFFKELLFICHERGETDKDGNLTLKLAGICARQYKYEEGRELYNKAISIMRETGNSKGEGIACGNFGVMCYHLGEYAQAIEYYEKALTISVEIGDRKLEALHYGNLGTVHKTLCENEKAKEYLEKALAINMEIGDRKREANNRENLGTVFQSLGVYAKAIDYHKKALALAMEIGDREQEKSSYAGLGKVFIDLGEYVQAKECFERALAIKIAISDKKGEIRDYLKLGSVFQWLEQYAQAKDCFQKALAISLEIGNREEIALSYANLGSLFLELTEYLQAKEYFEKALIGNGLRGTGEVTLYGKLGIVLFYLGDHIMAENYLEKALSSSEYIGVPGDVLKTCVLLSAVKLYQGKVEEARHHLSMGISKSEDLRGLLKDNDQLKISLSDANELTYRTFFLICCFYEEFNIALYILELRRARALADLMAAQYSVQSQISFNPQSWASDIENLMKKENDCTGLYISYFRQHVSYWVITKSGVIHFRRKKVNENDTHVGFPRNFEDFFAISFRSLGPLPDEKCEDRSLHMLEPHPKPSQEERAGSLTDLRILEDDEEELQDLEPLFYKMIFSPVADLLVEPEIIIVPERDLYHVPFAALRDEDGKVLSESFRIRIIPSLTTLKLIQDSPADYHSQYGALIVGDPLLGRVRYKGYVQNLRPLPCARKEADMIGQLLGIQPLLGEQATKQAVLQAIHSVSLIHFAAHGNAERGEIALSPVRSTNRIPQEEEYLLTMSDISQVQLRAKLVVLSCCHSGQGQIRAEGVIGIARAFLGSGARSVLVALWALEDSATEQLMRRFYEHLVRGESASESLHEAMKWMRCNGYSDVRQWAPFMLIGDNVTFDFGKIKEEKP